MTKPTLYFVTDVEIDGPNVGLNSMLSFASVCVDAQGQVRGDFETVLQPLPDRTADPDTMAWWATHPLAWAAATQNAMDPGAEMNRFADWVDSFDQRCVFASRPLLLDGMWIDAYLRRFTDTRIFDGPFEGRKIFQGAGLDIPSYLMGVLGLCERVSTYVRMPPHWLGHHPHTHRAIDDARGYDNLLWLLFSVAGDRAATAQAKQEFLDANSQ
ncbi:MAG: DNA polymerase III subunit epsilon [Pseudomonadota bacterium]